MALFRLFHFELLQRFFGSDSPEAHCQTSEAPCRAVLARPVSTTIAGPGTTRPEADGEAKGSQVESAHRYKLAKLERHRIWSPGNVEDAEEAKCPEAVMKHVKAQPTKQQPVVRRITTMRRERTPRKKVDATIYAR